MSNVVGDGNPDDGGGNCIVGSIEVADVMNPEKQVVSLTAGEEEAADSDVATTDADGTERSSGRVRTPSAIIREQALTSTISVGSHADATPGQQVTTGLKRKLPQTYDRSKVCSFLECCEPDDTENLLTCHICANSGHQRCLEFSDALWHACKTAPRWECIECKQCVVCEASGNESVLQFCDGCDCGVHLYCLEPLTYTIPKADYLCYKCVTSNEFPKVTRTTQEIMDFAAEYNRRNSGDDAFVPDAEAPPVPAADDKGGQTVARKQPRKNASKAVGRPRTPKSPSKNTARDLARKKQDRKPIKLSVVSPSAAATVSKSKKKLPHKDKARILSVSASAVHDALTLVDPIVVHTSGHSTTASKAVAKRKSGSATSLPRGSSASRKSLDGGDGKSTPRGSGRRRASGDAAPTAGDKKRRTSAPSPQRRRDGPTLTLRDAKRMGSGGTQRALSAAARRRLGGDDDSDDDSDDMAPRTQGPGRKHGGGRKLASAKVVVRGGTKVVVSPVKPRKKGEPTADDERLYQQAVANAAAATPAPASGADTEKRWIALGDYEIQTWFSAPYPEEYAVLPKLYLCEFCLKYMKSEDARCRHREKCEMDGQPPGVEIYRNLELQVWEVDGATSTVYCQNLCLLSKLFLDHKTLYYDVETFVFYVLTVRDAFGAHFVGYFSKEKDSGLEYNLSCIMTLPRVQRSGYGRFLIAFSYLLSRHEKKPGTPEKPLSPLGVRAYKSYWRSAVLDVFASLLDAGDDVALSVDDISVATGITPSDVEATLRDLGFVSVFDGQPVLVVDPAVVRAHVVKTNHSQRSQHPHLALDPSKLQWKPHAERVDWI